MNRIVTVSVFSSFLTVLAPLATPVQAQDILLTIDNFAIVEQDGADNVAEVDQAGFANRAGTEDLSVIQNGYGNSLTIVQDGKRNFVGTSGNGFQQLNAVRGAPGANIAEIEQSGDDNRVDQIVQQMTGAVPGAGNRLLIDQSGDGANVIEDVRQTQYTNKPGQSAEIYIEGFGNRIETISQESLSSLRGEENEIFVSIVGDTNGTQALRGVAQLPQITVGRLVQTGGTEDTGSNGNSMQLQIQAHDTSFAIFQRGRGNRTGPVVIVGDANSIGIDQDGLDNDLSVGLIEGTDNEIGISQYVTNSATLSLLGNSDLNSVLIDQMGTNQATVVIEGDLNEVTAVQGYLGGLGGTNDLDLSVTGDSNVAHLMQEGLENKIKLQVDGNLNNGGHLQFSTTPASSGLTAGNFEQYGADNGFTGEIVGDRNLAAFLQQGNLNMIMLSVTGDDNEAALRQIGSGNSAGVSQSGRANVAMVLQ